MKEDKLEKALLALRVYLNITIRDEMIKAILTNKKKTAFDFFVGSINKRIFKEVKEEAQKKFSELMMLMDQLVKDEKKKEKKEVEETHEHSLDFYCVKCRCRRVGKDTQTVTMKNGKHAQKSMCEVCGTAMFKIGD